MNEKKNNKNEKDIFLYDGRDGRLDARFLLRWGRDGYA